MKQQDVFKKIGIIIKELNDQYDYLVENEHEINDLELELFVANAHFLADHAEVLRKVNLNKPAAPQKPAPGVEPRFFEPVVQPALPLKEEPPAKPVVSQTSQINADENPAPHIDLRGDDTGADYSYTRQEPEIIRHELSVNDIPNWDEEEEEPVAEPPYQSAREAIREQPKVEAPKPEPVQPVKKPGPVKVEAVEAKEEEPPLTINQRISAQLKNNGGPTEQHASTQLVTDLKQAITLNDKLLYIKDLFNGYNLAYSEAIDILNRFNSFDEADQFLKSNYSVKNNWDSKQSTVDKLYELLRRRYV